MRKIKEEHASVTVAVRSIFFIFFFFAPHVCCQRAFGTVINGHSGTLMPARVRRRTISSLKINIKMFKQTTVLIYINFSKLKMMLFAVVCFSLSGKIKPFVNEGECAKGQDNQF